MIDPGNGMDMSRSLVEVGEMNALSMGIINVLLPGISSGGDSRYE